VEGNAGFIVSSDHHITDLKTFLGIPIVNPRYLFEADSGTG